MAPELRPKWAEHLRENFDHALPHLFMGEVAEWFVSSDLSEPRRRLCDLLEEALLGGSKEVRELVQVSFIENLPSDPPAWVSACFGPSLAADLRRYLQ